MEVSTNLGRVSLVPRGEYSPDVIYERLDLVQYQGSGYIALRTVQGVTPTDGNDFMLLAQRGRDGTDDSSGSAGADGSGVPNGGASGQVLAKKSNADYDTQWIDLPSGSLTLPEGLFAVRPISSDPSLGNVSGGGLVFGGVMTSVSAEPIGNNTFSAWKENGEVVSADSMYSFVVGKDRTLTAEFTAESLITWTTHDLPEEANWCSVAYGNGTFVALAYPSSSTEGENRVAYSTDDGKTWKASAFPQLAKWVYVTYGNGVFVAISLDNKTAYSADNGKTWTMGAQLSDGDSARCVAYGDGVFIAVSTDSAGKENSISKDNGKTWQKLSIPVGTLRSIVYGSYNGTGRFLTCRKGRCAYSTDAGVSWNTSDLPDSVDCPFVCYGNGVFVAIAGFSEDAAVYSTDGGVTWKASKLPEKGSWYHVAYGGGVFIAIRNYSSKFAYSTDNGKTWELGELPISDNNSVVYNGSGVFVVVGYKTNKAVRGTLNNS